MYSLPTFLLSRNYYIRNARGEVMANYKSTIDTVAESMVYTVALRNIYDCG